MLHNSLYRADDDLLVNTHIYGARASQAPVMRLRRVEDGTMVTTYAECFDRVWSESRPIN